MWWRESPTVGLLLWWGETQRVGVMWYSCVKVPYNVFSSLDTMSYSVETHLWLVMDDGSTPGINLCVALYWLDGRCGNS